MIGSRRRGWRLCTAAAVLAVGLWLVAGWGGRGTSGTGRAPARTERAHPVSVVPLHNNGASVELAPGTGTESGDSRSAPPIEPVSEADVHPPAPAEALLPAPPETRAPDRDTGLVFRDPVPGDTATETKQLRPSDPSSASSRPIQSAAAADVRPPPDPAISLPAPARTGPDRDTGLVFSNEPGATDKR